MKAIGKLKDDARSYELSEEWDKAIDAYLQVLRLVEQGDGSDLDLPLYNRVGDIYVRLGRPMDAVMYYEQAADRYAEAGLYNNAIALCNKALRYDPARLPLLRKLGSFSASQGFFTDARRWYLEYTEKSLKRGALDDAFSALADLANVTDDVEIRELLARQLREHGRVRDAVEEFKRAHALRVSARQHAEADALRAELQLLDPDVDMSSTEIAAAAPQAYDAVESDALPGFTDFEYPEFEKQPPVEEPAPVEQPAPVEEVAPVEEEAPERFDLADIEFSEAFVDFSAAEFTGTDTTSIADDVPGDSEDTGPIDVEVEEEHALLALPDFTFEPQTEFAEPAEPFRDLLDLEAEAADQADFDLTMLDFSESAEADAGESVEFDPLPPFELEQGSIGSFDDAEFGDYQGPPARVFDFSDAESEVDSWPPPMDAMEADDAAGEAAGQIAEESGFEADAVIETPLADGVEASVEVEAEREAEPKSETREPVFEADDETYFEPAFVTTDEPAFDEPTESPAEAEAAAAAETTLTPDAANEFESADAEPEPALQPLLEAMHESPVELVASAPPAVSMPSPQRKEYVDLAALIDEGNEEEAEASTRFVVAEIPPTGDEEKDFADMLQQFKLKVAESIPKEDAGSHYDLGIAFKEMGLIDEAIGEFQTALRSGQEKLKVYEELGSCFMLKQQYSVAIAVLSRAQQMPFTDETEMLGVYYNLGRAHEELGQRAEARTAFERIVAVDISFQDTTQRLARL